MRERTLASAFPGNFFPFVLVTAAFLLCTFCAGEPETPLTKIREEEQLRNRPALIVPSPQETVYSGEAQPLSCYYGGEGEPRVIYYLSAEDREENRGGSAAAPAEAGTYYARVTRPREAGFASGEELFADYRILKRPVTIMTQAKQEAVYNGDPKRVWAEVTPALPLVYSYYPNPGLMETAVASAKEAAGGGGAAALTGAYKGYTRVERAPIEQGNYYVWVYYPGDNNNERAEAFVEFTILPPRKR